MLNEICLISVCAWEWSNCMVATFQLENDGMCLLTKSDVHVAYCTLYLRYVWVNRGKVMGGSGGKGGIWTLYCVHLIPVKTINTYDYIIRLIKRRENNIINFMRIYCFFIWTNLNPPHPRMLCAKIGWNWFSGAGEEDFLISSMYFHYFVIISPWKEWGPLFEQTWISFSSGELIKKKSKRNKNQYQDQQF